MTEACTLIIFGATGNLAQVKLLPALYHLEAAAGLLSSDRIVCPGAQNSARKDGSSMCAKPSPSARATLQAQLRHYVLPPHALPPG